MYYNTYFNVLFLSEKTGGRMEPYNFWQDFFDTYQSLSDWVKVLWLVVPPTFILGLVVMVMRMRIDDRRAGRGFAGKLVYSVHRDEEDRLHIVVHGTNPGDQPALLFPELSDMSGRGSRLAQDPTGRPLPRHR